MTKYGTILRDIEREYWLTTKGTRRARVLYEGGEAFAGLVGSAMIDELKWSETELVDWGFTPSQIESAFILAKKDGRFPQAT